MHPIETKSNEESPRLRLDVPLHDLLTHTNLRRAVARSTNPEKLPDPVFPQYPELLGDDGLGPPIPPPKRHYTAERTTRGINAIQEQKPQLIQIAS
jgi:hypothetical protein